MRPFVTGAAAVTTFLYYELLFQIAVAAESEPVSVVIKILFSLSYGAVFAILMRPATSHAVNKIITAVWLFMVPVLYLVEYFVYRSFNVFYDLNTVLNGAGGAVTGFGGDIMRIVLSPEGVICLALFYLPFLAFVFYGNKKLEFGRVNSAEIAVYLAYGIVFFLCGSLVVESNDRYRHTCSEEYSYQNVVSGLGFGTGLRLELARLMFGAGSGQDGGEFVFETEAETERKTEKKEEKNDGSATVSQNKAEDAEKQLAEVSTSPEETVPVTYEPNTLDIDFEALAETADGRTGDIDRYVASLPPTMKNEYTGLFEGKNLIFMTAEAFSGYIIDPELTPALYRMATEGIQFKDYYQPAIAGTTGGEYANIFGLLPTSGGKSISIITKQNTCFTIAGRLTERGYYGKAYHNNDRNVYHRDETHNRLGYSDGFMGVGNGMEEYLTTRGFPASDLEMLQGTFPTYVDKQPFNIYYMTVSGHGQYIRKKNQMASKNYDRVKHLDHSEIVKCYLACNMPLEDAAAYLIEELEKAGIADDTVIVIGADHFPYNLDTGASPGHMPNLSELYGFEVNNYLERDSNRLIIWSGCLEKMEPIVVDEPVFSLDILPTLCNLFGVEYESRLFPGRDVFSDKEPLVFMGNYDWKTDKGTYFSSKNRFEPVSDEIDIPEDYVNQIRTEVKNRMNYCRNVLSCDYFDHVFGTR
ncbi:MAG: LTA synthase family protein [Lachnospiraceae bacterium]|nr:LTA synthase family protein [Lachnospiraceae bacterium]